MDFLTLSYIYVGIFGLLFGSFLNALSYRLREDIPLTGRSKCTKCGSQIRWYDNIPLFGWIQLGGKCRDCKEPISFQYPLIEGITSGVFLLTLYLLTTFGTQLPIDSIVHWLNFDYRVNSIIVLTAFLVFAFLFVAIGLYDFKWKEIPNEYVVALLILSIPFLIANPWNLIAGIAGFLFFVIQFEIVMRIYKVEAVGMGDAKLSLALGFILGKFFLPAMLIAYFSAVGYAGIYFIYTKIAKKEFDKEIPFGPFIMLGSYISLFFLLYPFQNIPLFY